MTSLALYTGLLPRSTSDLCDLASGPIFVAHTFRTMPSCSAPGAPCIPLPPLAHLVPIWDISYAFRIFHFTHYLSQSAFYLFLLSCLLSLSRLVSSRLSSCLYSLVFFSSVTGTFPCSERGSPIVSTYLFLVYRIESLSLSFFTYSNKSAHITFRPGGSEG